MKLVLAAAALTTMFGAASANQNDLRQTEWSSYRSFLTEPMCGVVDDEKSCEQALLKWRRDFQWATDPNPTFPNGAQITGQRNLAYCFSTGCDGQVAQNPLLACAWAKVVLLFGDPAIGSDDIAFEDEVCSRLGETERLAARAQADRILKLFPVPGD